MLVRITTNLLFLKIKLNAYVLCHVIEPVNTRHVHICILSIEMNTQHNTSILKKEKSCKMR